MHESYRTILHWFRPRSEYPPWVADVALALSLLLILGVLISSLVNIYRRRRHTWRAFRSSAQERGLTRTATDLLWRIARQDRMKHPLLLLISVTAFERHVGRYAARAGSQKNAGDANTHDQLSHIRRALGFDRLADAQQLHTTRELEPGQGLTVWTATGRPEDSCQLVVVHCDDHAIRALLDEGDPDLAALRPGSRVKVCFRRAHGAEYGFRSEVLDFTPETKTAVIRHADHLERLERRGYVRLPVTFDLEVSAVSERDRHAGASDSRPSAAVIPVRGKAIDISGGGLGLLSHDEIPSQQLLVLDPAAHAPFPVANLQCRVVEQHMVSEGFRAHLQLVRPPPERAAQLLGRIYREQAHRVAA